jgi:hypothetical protein
MECFKGTEAWEDQSATRERGPDRDRFGRGAEERSCQDERAATGPEPQAATPMSTMRLF